ncbi:high affinity copper uptake protein 1 [Patella vulgata]|uniref:high affinity copper uptake protein 1 n=1 Tax=Patella vulgata TaxID=6465 RepID=UPI0024A93307|nr:high affinity copper uptake protein 1 [Patella vulgata]
MGMPMNHSMPMMPMYFVTKTKLQNFIFENLNITDIKGLVAVCFVVFTVTFLFEALKLLQIYFQLRVRQDPLSYAKTDTTVTDRSILLTPLLIPVDIQQIRKQRLKYHFYGCLSHMINLAVAYFIMLAFMTYNVWLGISVVSGATLGYYVFAAIGNQITQKFTEVTSKNQALEIDSESNNTSTQADSTTAENCHM